MPIKLLKDVFVQKNSSNQSLYVSLYKLVHKLVSISATLSTHCIMVGYKKMLVQMLCWQCCNSVRGFSAIQDIA